MKCPKCSYIGFEATDRCRNCGYEFALAREEPPAPELALRSGEADGPLTDLALRATPAAPRGSSAKAPLDLDRVIGEPQAPDLPLFDGDPREARDEPASPAAAPRRAPARRPAPDIGRPRRPRETDDGTAGTLSLPLPETREPAPIAAARASALGAELAPAPPVPRVLAAVLDTLLLTSINVLVVYFTVRLVGLALAEWTALPLLPLSAFFLLLNGGYLVAFTVAGGQTIGKMAFGLRVVPESDGYLSLGRATVRAFGAIASACCLGAGLLPALLQEGGRSVPDRLAETRVIRVA